MDSDPESVWIPTGIRRNPCGFERNPQESMVHFDQKKPVLGEFTRVSSTRNGGSSQKTQYISSKTRFICSRIDHHPPPESAGIRVDFGPESVWIPAGIRGGLVVRCGCGRTGRRRPVGREGRAHRRPEGVRSRQWGGREGPLEAGGERELGGAGAKEGVCFGKSRRRTDVVAAAKPCTPGQIFQGTGSHDMMLPGIKSSTAQGGGPW